MLVSVITCQQGSLPLVASKTYNMWTNLSSRRLLSAFILADVAILGFYRAIRIGYLNRESSIKLFDTGIEMDLLSTTNHPGGTATIKRIRTRLRLLRRTPPHRIGYPSRNLIDP